ncbi:MAG: biopolymer transporter ExbD, partial [Verrucomicrobiaceae bacterium]
TKLPGTESTETDTPLPDEIAIRIEDDGQVYLNDDPLDAPASKDLPELAGNLNALRESSTASKSDVLVTIYANDLARYERVVEVLDALSRAKISNVTFQAGSPE